MLLALRLVTRADVEPFLLEFAQLDADGSGVLDKDDLKAVAASRKAKAFRAARPLPALDPQLTRTVLAPITWARRLLFPSALAIINFTWHTWFGYLLFFSGCANAFAVRHLMGAVPTRASLLHGGALAAVAGLFACGAGIFLLMWTPVTVGGQESYLRLDQSAFDLASGGAIDGGGLLVEYSRDGSKITAAAEAGKELVNWQTMILTVVYFCFFPVVAVLDAVTAYTCGRAAAAIGSATRAQRSSIREAVARVRCGPRSPDCIHLHSPLLPSHEASTPAHT
eukprot:1928045-Prymnesium_polylepis.1